jgi:hypothetical protein
MSGESLRSYELKRNKKKLTIFHSSSLSHLPNDAKRQLFTNGSKLRAPDIAILKEEDSKFKLIAVIEIKNYLDKSSTNSAIKILSQIREINKDNNTKYAIFSSNGISIRSETSLKNILFDKNTFLIINREKMQNHKKIEFNVIDLSHS